MDTCTIYYRPSEPLFSFNWKREPGMDMRRIYTNFSPKSCLPAFLGTFPTFQFLKCKNNRAGTSGEAAGNIHYPEAPAGKTALNDSLTMTIGGVFYTVKSIFAENGGDLREMLEAAVVSRAARSLAGSPAGQEA